MNMAKRAAAALLALVVLFPYGWTVNVAATPATRARLAELERQREETQDAVAYQQLLIEGVRLEMELVLQQMYELDMRMVDALINLEASELALLETEVRMVDAEIELEAASEDRDRHYEALRHRLRVIHENGPVSWLDVLVQSSSIADFLVRFDYVRTISAFDQEMFARYEDAAARIENSLETLTRSRAVIGELQRTHERQLAELETIMEERAQWLESLAENEETLMVLLEIQEEELRAIEYEFGVVRARQVAEEEEERRQRRLAEEAAARQAAQQRESARQAEINALLNFDGRFAWPLPSRGLSDISSGFGSRTNPVTGRTEYHSGLDIPAPSGSRINAAADGIVRFAGWSGGFGLMLIIDHGSGYSTVYAHNSRNRVTQGQQVTRGQHIADVGTTGQSTGNHLHFEVRHNNAPVDPLRFFR